MSETVGYIVILVGLALSGAGMFFLTRTTRQILGLVIMAAGLAAAGTGLLTIEDTQVTERPPATREAATPEV